MADSNRCQGQCHVGGSQELFDKLIEKYYFLLCFPLGSGRELRTFSSLVFLWNVGSILVGIYFYDNRWVS